MSALFFLGFLILASFIAGVRLFKYQRQTRVTELVRQSREVVRTHIKGLNILWGGLTVFLAVTAFTGGVIAVNIRDNTLQAKLDSAVQQIASNEQYIRDQRQSLADTMVSGTKYKVIGQGNATFMTESTIIAVPEGSNRVRLYHKPKELMGASLVGHTLYRDDTLKKWARTPEEG